MTESCECVLEWYSFCHRPPFPSITTSRPPPFPAHYSPYFSMAGKGDRSPQGPCRFFKVLLDGFADKLRIPPKFATTVMANNGWKTAILKTCLGKTWLVVLLKDLHDFDFCGDGWQEFVQDNDLRHGYFLIFDHEGDMVFSVTVFDFSGCSKGYTPVTGQIVMDDKIDAEDYKLKKTEVVEVEEPMRRELTTPTKISSSGKKKSGIMAFKRPQFKVVLEPRHFRKKEYLHIPNIFVKLNDLSGMRQAILSNPEGQWLVRLYHGCCRNQSTLRFGCGWRAFWGKNKLKQGNICIFEILSKEENRVYFNVIAKQQEFPRKQCTPIIVESSVDQIT